MHCQGFRGRGMFQGLYQEMSVAIKEAGFDFIVTGVARINLRSRRAHEDVGFRPLPQPSESSENPESEYQSRTLSVVKSPYRAHSLF